MIDETFADDGRSLGISGRLRTVPRLIKAGKIPACPRRPPVAVSQARHRCLARQPAASRRRCAPRAAAPARPATPGNAPACACGRRRGEHPGSARQDAGAGGIRRGRGARRRSALERMRLYPYDLLIADLKMPGMDG